MSFQSLPREGWKTQKLLTKICHSCLSKRTPVISQMRRLTLAVPSKPIMAESKPKSPAIENIMLTTNKQNLLELFRTEIYQPHQLDNLNKYSPIVRKIIQRRETRKQLLETYRLIKNQQPALFNQFTREDFDQFMAYFLTKNPDDPRSNGSFHDAFEVFKDLKAGRLMPKVTFSQQDLKCMIYIACELRLPQDAEQLLKESQPNTTQESYRDLIRLFSRLSRLDKVTEWLEKMPGPYPRDVVHAVVMCHLHHNQLSEAAAFLRQHHPGQDLTKLNARHATDDREFLDQALSVFAKDALREWRLNDVRMIYKQKRYFDMSTHQVVRHLADKGLHTGQTATIEQLLSDTIYLKDVASTQLCARRLIGWYTTQHNIAHAVRVWQTLQQQQVTLPIDVLEPLLSQAAKLKYHVDALRLYQHVNQLYPNALQPATHLDMLRCLVKSKQFPQALAMVHQIEMILPVLRRSLARIAIMTLFGLSAQTGRLQLFERAFRASEQLHLNLVHPGLSSLIACYLSRQDLGSAKAAFQSMVAHTGGPDVVDFNLLIRTVAQESDAKDSVLEILKHMQMVNVEPDETTFRTLLGIYPKGSDIRERLMHRLLTEEPQSRFNQVFLNNIALTDLLSDRSVESVFKVFWMNDRSRLLPMAAKGEPIACDGLTFKILLDAATRDSRYSAVAQKVFKMMRARGMKPGKEVYDKIVRVLSQNGKVAKARRFITLMEQEVGVKADTETYVNLVDGLLYWGRLDLAQEVIEKDILPQHSPTDKVAHAKLKRVKRELTKKSLNPTHDS